MSDVKETKGMEEELGALLAESEVLQKKEMLHEGGGVQPDYVVIAKSGTRALKRSEKDLYIEGLAIGDFFIQREKRKLGHELHVVPLMFLKVYNEVDSAGRDAKFFGKWTAEQAGQYPLVEGSYFDRQLPNGHILKPTNWVVVEIKEAPDLKFPVIAYKSTGNRIWKAWKDDVRKRSGSSATLMYTIKEEVCTNADYDWTDIGFEFDSNLLESEDGKRLALTTLKKSNDMRKAYEQGLLIGKHSDADAGISPVTREVAGANFKALPEKSANSLAHDAADTEDSYDEELMGF